MLADRNIGWVIGTLSMLGEECTILAKTILIAAIKTGGILPQAICEQTYTKGLLWAQIPVAEALSIVVGGLLFARAMYAEGFVTIVDPFQVCFTHEKKLNADL